MRSAAILAASLALVGCSFLRVAPSPTPEVVTHSDPYPANVTGEWDAVLVVSGAGPGDRPGVSVEDALSAGTDEAPLVVSGVLFVDDAYGHVWLCSRVERDDAMGPHCGGSILLIESESRGAGLALSDYHATLLAAGSVDDLEVVGTVRWSADARFLGLLRISDR